ncbi:replication-associated recombination protein A [Thermosipho globiformans]|uniref:replication-associated recombination protein A n=1 Tax=Thermosipho globiformans TaxID=380685 RepID=UPI000F8EF63F|nr:replication-associated recombination protein A [Thermosipho globiformans]
MSGLSEILRPKNFEDVVGQEHILGKKGILKLAIEKDSLFSAIFYGPPGCGKTSTLEVIKQNTSYEVYHFNAAITSTTEVKKILEYAAKVKDVKKILIFIDEFHRFNKKQQDIFLPGVEAFDYVLIGATTENPYKMVNPALLSRVRLVAFKKLQKEHIIKLLEKAVNVKKVDINDDAKDFIARVSNGDGRFAINLYEILSDIAISIDKKIIDEEILQIYSSDGNRVYTAKEHYSLASAFIKSIRGSDPDAALYYMARMIEGGEDPRFIARRLVILASEDIGLADPMALLVATSTAQAVELVGLPECMFNLSQCVIYLSLAPKSNSSTLAIQKALDVAKETMNLDVPRDLLNIPDSGYKNPHKFGGFLKKSYLPKEISDKVFYTPKSIGKEKKNLEILETLWRGGKQYDDKS